PAVAAADVEKSVPAGRERLDDAPAGRLDVDHHPIPSALGMTLRQTKLYSSTTRATSGKRSFSSRGTARGWTRRTLKWRTSQPTRPTASRKLDNVILLRKTPSSIGFGSG